MSIPEHIMNFKNEKMTEVAARFMWLSNNSLKVISSEGIERKIEIIEEKNRPVLFHEIEFNVIPLFDQVVQVR